jgi:uncharacterized membrane protein YgaE (UPF0421/DUF939 family)
MKFWAWEEEPSFDHTRHSRSSCRDRVGIIARLVQMPEAYWAAIATLVVMQSTLGATLTLSIGRIVAAAVGASVGALEANYFRANLVAFAFAIFRLFALPLHWVTRPRAPSATLARFARSDSAL